VFANPTIKDFVARIDWHLSKALDKAKRDVSRVRSEMTGRGMLSSSVAVRLSVEAAQAVFEAGVDEALGELRRMIRETVLDDHEMRTIVEQRLRRFLAEAKEAAQVGDFRSFDPREMLAKFDQHLDFHLRQFDVGFHVPEEPEIPPMSGNSITVGNMTGNIQQNSPGGTQTFEFKLNIEAAQTALQTYESELNKIEVDDRARRDLVADIATIKAQLCKPSPSASILRETARSVRNVTEGIVGGLLTSPVMQAAIALGTALGWN
jgi:hypothetical protein